MAVIPLLLPCCITPIMLASAVPFELDTERPPPTDGVPVVVAVIPPWEVIHPEPELLVALPMVADVPPSCARAETGKPAKAGRSSSPPRTAHGSQLKAHGFFNGKSLGVGIFVP